MPKPPVSVSLGDGGCVFAHDPSLPVGPTPVAWLPELSPGTLILKPAPGGFDDLTALDPAQLGLVVADETDDEGRELVIVDGSGELHVRLAADHAGTRSAILLPPDSSFELRLDVALRFVRRLRGQRINLLPAALRLTPLQRQRLIQLLHAFDVHDAGGGPRDVAAAVLTSDHAQLPSIEWKDSHARRKANRLIHDSIALVERGYLKLLRGL
jgi:hypothetical protein